MVQVTVPKICYFDVIRKIMEVGLKTPITASFFRFHENKNLNSNLKTFSKIFCFILFPLRWSYFFGLSPDIGYTKALVWDAKYFLSWFKFFFTVYQDPNKLYSDQQTWNFENQQICLIIWVCLFYSGVPSSEVPHDFNKFFSRLRMTIFCGSTRSVKTRRRISGNKTILSLPTIFSF